MSDSFDFVNHANNVMRKMGEANYSNSSRPRLTWAQLRAHYVGTFGFAAEEIFNDMDRHMAGQPTKADEREGRS